MIRLKQTACPVCGWRLHEIEDAFYKCDECKCEVWPPEEEKLPSSDVQPEFYRSLSMPEGLIIKGSSRSSGRKRKQKPKKTEHFLEV